MPTWKTKKFVLLCRFIILYKCGKMNAKYDLNSFKSLQYFPGAEMSWCVPKQAENLLNIRSSWKLKNFCRKKGHARYNKIGLFT
jgi:hypothetical protein